MRCDDGHGSAEDGPASVSRLQDNPTCTPAPPCCQLFQLQQLTGEASSFGRRALVASVTHDGEILEPASLSAALDISPPIDDPTTDETDGPGPLASAALVEQIKRVEATKEVRCTVAQECRKMEVMACLSYIYAGIISHRSMCALLPPSP